MVGKRLLRYFLAGAFAILPLVVTIAIVIWVAGFLQRFLGQDTPIGRLVRQPRLAVLAGRQDAGLRHWLGGGARLSCSCSEWRWKWAPDAWSRR